MTYINIWSTFGDGSIRDLSDPDTVAEIELLPDDQRDKLFACVSAVKACGEKHEAIRVARLRVRDLEVGYNAALAADLAANKPTDHASALRAVIAANGGQKPKRVMVDKQTRGALAKATDVLAEARAVLNRETQALPALQRAESNAVLAWRACETTPNQLEVTRQYIQRGQDTKAQRVKDGLSAVPVPDVPPRQSEIDRVMSARGGHNNNTRRNAAVVPQVPDMRSGPVSAPIRATHKAQPTRPGAAVPSGGFKVA